MDINCHKEEWQWPLKYLKCYSFEGKVFPFEGHGIVAGNYTVMCKEAKELFDTVARNISQGMHQEEPQLVIDESPTISSPPLFPPKRHLCEYRTSSPMSYTDDPIPVRLVP